MNHSAESIFNMASYINCLAKSRYKRVTFQTRSLFIHCFHFLIPANRFPASFAALSASIVKHTIIDVDDVVLAAGQKFGWINQFDYAIDGFTLATTKETIQEK